MILLRKEVGNITIPAMDTATDYVAEASENNPAFLIEVLDKVKTEYIKSGIYVAHNSDVLEETDLELSATRKENIPNLLVKLKNFKVEESENEEGEKVGIIKGDANVKNIIDLGGDKVLSSAFVQTLKHKGGKVILLSDHFYTMADVAGVAYLEDTEKSLRLKGEINLDTQQNKDLFSNIKFLMKRGVAPGLSIGYDVIKASPNDAGGYDLHELSVHEVSVTPFPMNTQSLIDYVKNFKNRRKRRQALLQKTRSNAPEAVV